MERYIPHCGLFRAKTLRQQIQRTQSTDRAVRKDDDEDEGSVPGLVCWGWTATSSFTIRRHSVGTK